MRAKMKGNFIFLEIIGDFVLIVPLWVYRQPKLQNTGRTEVLLPKS